MKIFKKAFILAAVVLMVGTASVSVLAATYSSPAELTAGLTGKTVDEIIAEKSDSGKTYGTLADEAGKLTEFKDGMLQIRKDRLNERVSAGRMTQEQADQMIVRMQENQADCDASGQQNGTGMAMQNGGNAALCTQDGTNANFGKGMNSRRGNALGTN